MTFGKVLLHLRGSMSRKTLGDKLGVAEGYIWLLEHDRRRPSVSLCESLEEIFGLNPYVLSKLSGIDLGRYQETLRGISGEQEGDEERLP